MASPSPVNSMKVDSPPRVEVVRPRRATVAQRLQTNATLEAFEETDLFAKVSGYLSEVRVDIGDHVKAGQVLAVIDVPEMQQELAEAKAQLESKRSSLESAPPTGPQQGKPGATERPCEGPGATWRGKGVHQ
jgi:multidrug efflux pump subunit AcrA (membrane-fusion protein)